MRLTIMHTLDAEMTSRLRNLYTAAFLPLRGRAAARHLLSADEFAAEMADARIDKYVAWSHAGLPVGLTTLTTELTAVAWIEPEFYAARHGEVVARSALFYLGYTLVSPRASTFRVFKTMADAVCARVAACHGILAFDSCTVNAVGAVGRFTASMQRAYGADVKVVDNQTYYIADFTNATPRAPRSGLTP
jgi:hypothetical protein